MFKFLKSFFSGLSVEEIQILALPRSSKWKKLRIQHLEKNPVCAVCGSKKNIVPHHVVPVHVDPSRELDPTNLISLCENQSFNCHLFFGHLKNWSRCNPNVIEDAQAWNLKLNQPFESIRDSLQLPQTP